MIKLKRKTGISAAVLAMAVCTSVRLSVCLSKAGIVSKPLNTFGTEEQHGVIRYFGYRYLQK